MVDRTRAAIEHLRSWSAPTPDQEALRAHFIDHLEREPDGLSKRCRPAHLTAGVLVISDNGTEVLLNLHRKARRWFHFGGHIEDSDLDLPAAALREGVEESGIRDLVIDANPVHLSQHQVPFCGEQGTVDHLDVRYVARVASGTTPILSEESVELSWFPVDDLPTDEPDMLELVALARG